MFITIEGIDGCGKSTQSLRLAEWLERETHRESVRTFEPGGYPDGMRLREFILRGEKFSPLAELMLFLADRAEHVERVILPAIASGKNVICERWNESTLAYQSGGHKAELGRARELISACKFPKPDAKIFLDVEPEIALSRVIQREKGDKFEDEGLALMRRVAEFYRELADSGELTRIDCGTLNEDEVFAAITEAVQWQFR